MFPPQRYATAAVDRKVPLAVQLFLFQCIDALTFLPEYLQVSPLSVEDGKLRIAHTQKSSDHNKEYLLLPDITVTSKIYVINDETHATVLFCEEY